MQTFTLCEMIFVVKSEKFCEYEVCKMNGNCEKVVSPLRSMVISELY